MFIFTGFGTISSIMNSGNVFYKRHWKVFMDIEQFQ
ncbi:hypothetical protein CLOLEP_02321 [[Clostridium] leptum DSM 753]|uniref:Uncharacterized protein n=1 Tax=[Clostridium] leptum DSM 753 TaxID=428125 RepID=A7VUS4_9FIRM|nr:hypothetical protein CLOLEP_02321 [[Clostridium] leptum DSM 753]